jgi:PTS system sucrose-specific IIC component
MIAVFLMCQIDKWLHKHVPEMLDLFITPLTTVLVTSYITFTIIGPIFATLETWVLAGAKVLVRNPFGACVMGAIYPWTVVMGLHHMYNVIEAGMLAESGLNTWMPIASAANFAQFGACLAVGLKAKNMKTKAVAIPSSMSAALGITEPAIFGVNMRFFKPFIAGMAGGAVGSIFGALTGLGATAYGVTGIPGYLTINNPLVYTVLLAVSGGIAFVLTNILWKEEETAPKAAPAAKAAAAEKGAPDAWALETEAGIVKSPVNGKIIPAKDIPDPVFAQETMGPSVGIEPTEGIVYAPFDGTVMMVFPTNHAIGLKADNGIELLIHVGVDTVKMNGDGFELFVREGDRVTKGQKLLTFDMEKIRAAGCSTTVAVLVINSDDFSSCETKLGRAEAGDQIILIRK